MGPLVFKKLTLDSDFVRCYPSVSISPYKGKENLTNHPTSERLSSKTKKM